MAPNSIINICTRALHSVLSFAHYRAASSVIPLLPKATLTPSTQPNLDLLCTRLHLLLPSSPFQPYNTRLFSPRVKTSRYSLIHSTRQLIAIPALLGSSSFLTQSIRVEWIFNPYSRTFTLVLSALLIPHASAPYNAVGTITPSCRHFLAFIPNPILLSILFGAHHALCPSPCFMPLIHSVYYIHFSSSIHCHLRFQVIKIIHFL